jgi:hypothetical protein
MNGPPPPANCAACVYFASLSVRDGHCRRHPPSPGHEEFELAHWPKVRPIDRCGAGAAMTDGTGPRVVRCGTCVHWYRPNDEPVRPDYRKGLSVDWWSASGFCTCLAPSPGTDEERHVHWKVTHAADGCGDGGAA